MKELRLYTPAPARFKRSGEVLIDGKLVGTVKRRTRRLTGLPVYKFGRHVAWGGTRLVVEWIFTPHDGGADSYGSTRLDAVENFLSRKMA